MASDKPSPMGTRLSSILRSAWSFSLNARIAIVSADWSEESITLPDQSVLSTGYQSARPNELHTLFEVDAVAGLVGVDEGEIVLFLLAVADQPAQGFLGRCNPQVDLSPDISPGHQKWNPTCCKRKTLAIFQV